MKKEYAAPMLIQSGNVVRVTLGGSQTDAEGGTKKDFITGGVGYYL